MPQIVSAEHLQQAQNFKQVFATYRQNQDLINIGAYAPGTDPGIDEAINLYPSLCFFEGTNVSVGRGTDYQFQVYGSPFMTNEKLNYCFTPQPNLGAKHPKHEQVSCCGYDLSD